MKFKEEYIDLVISISLSNKVKNIPNALIAKRIGCPGSDIETWRKKHHLFDVAFKDPKTLLREKIWQCALSLLKTRTCSTITYDSAGNVVSREEREILTTHDDVLCAKQLIDEYIQSDEGVTNARLVKKKTARD